ncbi:hypothetical protein JW868_00945, partial [Candidatus Woesearchaeota archaeon]|nr:hypothetical protein [Candidatus Woesearchaeota archaeon]
MRHRVLALKSKVREIIGKNPGPPLSSLDDIQEYIDKGIVRVPANTLSHDLTLPVTVLHRHGPVGFCWLENDTTGRYLVIASMNYEGSIPESAVHADDSGIPKPIVESIMVPLNDGLPEFNYINNIGNDKILVLALQGLPASFGRQILYNVSQSRILGINPESD